ncbi:MAG: hypothetical protein IBJ00_01075 [Alphaproteobacteria bacterium]|nr:hypothetical protein [Alphaproteobacteria bacterium]
MNKTVSQTKADKEEVKAALIAENPIRTFFSYKSAESTEKLMTLKNDVNKLDNSNTYNNIIDYGKAGVHATDLTLNIITSAVNGQLPDVKDIGATVGVIIADLPKAKGDVITTLTESKEILTKHLK